MILNIIKTFFATLLMFFVVGCNLRDREGGEESNLGEEIHIPEQYDADFEIWMISYEKHSQALLKNNHCEKINNPDVSDAFLRLAKLDQEIRQIKPLDRNQMNEVDAKNTRLAKKIVLSSGWPKKCDVSQSGIDALWLVVQHTQDDQFRADGLKWIYSLYEANLISGIQFAMSFDRAQIENKLPQVYGTQMYCDKNKDMWVLFEQKDMALVNIKRKKMGLMPLEIQLAIENYKSNDNEIICD